MDLLKYLVGYFEPLIRTVAASTNFGQLTMYAVTSALHNVFTHVGPNKLPVDSVKRGTASRGPSVASYLENMPS